MGSIGSEDHLRSVEASRYIMVASTTFLLYDHLIALDLEIANVWTNKHQRIWHKISFVLNRYFPEAVMVYVLQIMLGFSRGLHDTDCRRFIWVFTLSATTMVIVSQFAINLRVYQTWGLQKKMTTLLTIGFMMFNLAAGGLAISVGLRLQDAIAYDSVLMHTCSFEFVPNELPYLYGLLAAFDLFLIMLAGYNALEKPHQTNSGVLSSFLMYGSILFFLLFGTRLTTLILSIVANPVEVFSATCVSVALNSMLVSRMHLRLDDIHYAPFRPRNPSF